LRVFVSSTLGELAECVARLVRGERDGEDRGERRQRTVDQADHRGLCPLEQERSLMALSASRGNDGCHVIDAANRAARRRRLREASSTWSWRMRRPVQVLRWEHPEMGPLPGRRRPESQRGG
jgi:hypothetical protein